MTITEAKTGNRPNRVRCFPSSAPLVESIAKEKWDLVKIMCTQPFNNRIQYGVSFITLHTPEDVKNNDSPLNQVSVAKQVKVENSDDKKIKFGKFTLRENSDSDSDTDKKKNSPFNRWKNSKSEPNDSKVSIKDQVRAKLEENRKRIRLIPDSSDEEEQKPKLKPNRNRTSGLVYEDEDDEPNDRLQKKIDKDKEQREKKTPKLLMQRDHTVTNSDRKSKFDVFVNDDGPSTSSSSRNRSPTRTSKPLFSSSSSNKKSPRKDKESERKTPKTPASAPPKDISYKPFHKLLEGVVFAFSGYVNPERGIVRQKALDMGAKYKPDWDSSCTHLM